MTEVQDTRNRATKKKRRIARCLVLVWAFSSTVLIGGFHLLLFFLFAMAEEAPTISEMRQMWWWFGVLPILLAWVTAAISWRWEQVGGALLVLEGLLLLAVILFAMATGGAGVLGLVPLLAGLVAVVAGILLLQISWWRRMKHDRVGQILDRVTSLPRGAGLWAVIGAGILTFTIAVILLVSASGLPWAEPQATPAPQLPGVISPENAHQVTELSRWGEGSVEVVTFSPDGQTLASLGRWPDRAVRVWQVPNGELLRTLELGTTVPLWQKADAELLDTLAGGHVGQTMVLSPDGQTLAEPGCRFGRCVVLRRVSDGSMIRTLTPEHQMMVYSVALSPDGQTLASGCGAWEIRLWRVSDGQLLATMRDLHVVQSLAFSPDGQTLASGSWANTVRLWHVADGRLLRTLKGHTGWVYSVAFSPDGQTLASGSNDRTIRLWRVSDGAPMRTLEGHTDLVKSLAFSPDGKTLASGSKDGTIRLWGIRGD